MTGKRIAVILGFAAFGGVIGFAGTSLAQPAFDDPGFNWPLMFLAIVFAGVGIANIVASANSRLAAAAMRVDLSGDCDIAPERRLLRLSGILMLIAGAAMLLPALGERPLGMTGETAFAAVLAILVVESIINWRVWRSSDELMRRIMGETCAVAFWAFQLLLFVWAVGAHFGVIASFEPLDIVASMMAIYIVAAGIIGARRGMG